MREVSDEVRARLRAAASVFAERGFDGATIELISAATGVPSSTLYYNLAGKQGILEFLLEDFLQRMASAVDEAIATEGSAAVRLDGVIRAQLRVLADEPATCQMLLMEMGRIDSLPALAHAVRHAFHHPVAKVLADGAADGSLRSVDVETATSAVFGAVTLGGLHHVVANPGVVPAFDAEAVADRVLDLVLEGLGSR
jgi:AcrR family transcriptional regulator